MTLNHKMTFQHFNINHVFDNDKISEHNSFFTLGKTLFLSITPIYEIFILIDYRNNLSLVL